MNDKEIIKELLLHIALLNSVIIILMTLFFTFLLKSIGFDNVINSRIYLQVFGISGLAVAAIQFLFTYKKLKKFQTN